MKTRLSLLVFSFCLIGSSLLLASCDKIEQDQYWVFAGANGTWYDTDETIPDTQNAFVEKYTGVRCVNCPKADEVLHAALGKYGDRLTVVAIHSGPLARPYGSDEDLRTENGEAWYSYFGISSQPAGMVMRTKSGSNWDIFTPTSNFDSKIDQVLDAPTVVGMKTNSVTDDEGNRAVDVFLSFQQEVADSLTLTVLIIEDKIYTTQESPAKGKVENYEQNHVLRCAVTDPWGIDVDARGEQGEKRFIRLYFDMNPAWNPENCTLVAFVSDKATRRILNVVRTQM